MGEELGFVEDVGGGGETAGVLLVGFGGDGAGEEG